jgi:hypothetical protein
MVSLYSYVPGFEALMKFARSLLPKGFDLFRRALRYWHDVVSSVLQGHSQARRLSATFLDLRAGPSRIVRQITGNGILGQVQLPYRFSLVAAWQVKEESAEREPPTQLRCERRDRIAGCDPEAPTLRYGIDNLKSRSQPASGSANKGVLHCRKIECDSRHSRSIASGLTHGRFSRPWRSPHIMHTAMERLRSTIQGIRWPGRRCQCRDVNSVGQSR